MYIVNEFSPWFGLLHHEWTFISHTMLNTQSSGGWKLNYQFDIELAYGITNFSLRVSGASGSCILCTFITSYR